MNHAADRPPSLSGCPGCGAPRAEGPECPRCGIIYAKADLRAHPGADSREPSPGLHPPRASDSAAEDGFARASAPEPLPEPPYPSAPPRVWEGRLEDARIELKLRLFAVPIALGVAVLFVQSGFGHFVMRTFLSMWIHELGHAVAAWLCGFPAAPGPWKTLISEARSVPFVLLLITALAALAVRAWRTERPRWLPVLGAVFLLQLSCTLVLPLSDARTLITFCGDAGCMVLGTLLMCTFYAPEQSSLRVGWLRWGFLVIGAAALVDPGNTWWAARSNVDVIPFGEQEGVGLSDPSRLTEWAGWSVTQLIHRYEVVLILCVIALALIYAWGLRRARLDVRAAGG